jgi:nucleoside-diphosphate-sugar epimerase
MIKWITDFLGTSPYFEQGKETSFHIVDVRDLVDKKGNSEALVREIIESGTNKINNNLKIVVCCDYGMSRSNAIATGILVKTMRIPFDRALQKVLKKTNAEIKMEVLDVVKKAVDQNQSLNIKKNIKRKRILVIGNPGCFRGSISDFLNKDNTVFLLEENLNSSCSPLHLGEFCEKNNITHILNLGYQGISNSYGSFGQNFESLRNILELFKNKPSLTMIYLSNSLVFSGYRSSFFVADEETPLHPKGLQAENIYFQEKLIKYYVQRYNLKVCVVRTSTCYGTEEGPRFIYNFIRRALSYKDICTHEYINAAPMVHMIHIDDLQKALGLLLLKGFSQGYYNLSGPDFLSTFDLAQKIIDITNSKSRIKTHKIDDSTANIFLNSEKAQCSLQWKPSVVLEKIMPLLIEKIQGEQI